jgi:hypothetical protein
MLDTIVSLILIALVTADLVVMSRSNKKLRAQLLELATERAAKMSVHSLKIECDNTQALVSLAEVQLAAERAAATLERVATGAMH